MNRLILLGNGFDLAHQLKTSYNDFILWYLVSSMEEAQANGQYDDGILSVKKNPQFITPVPPDVEKIVKFLYHNSELEQLYKGEPISFKDDKVTHHMSLKLTVHTEFLKSLINDCTTVNWVDIENMYYSALKTILERKPVQIDEKAVLQQLNVTMGVLTNQLERYLKTQKPRDQEYEYDQIFEQKLLEKEFVHWDKVEKKELEQTYILNFNYTPTIEMYRISENDAGHRINVNYIHGQISRPKNPLIFGFGDELDENYKRLEDHPIKGLFKHIKSFGYFKTRNYHNLIRYIESGQFQVFVIGHSCGLSDRTMLNMIFEHDNCMSIKIYYHQIDQTKNNYTELTEEISRHFKSKIKMRERIVSFEDCQRMPQLY